MLPVMKSYIRILIIAGIVVLATLAVWKGVSRPQVAAVPGTSESPSISPQASTSPLVLVYDPAPKDWATYSSKSMGFSVAYPTDWRVGVCGPQCVGWSPSTIASGQFILGIIKSDNTIEGLLEKAAPYLIAKEDIKAGGLSWLKLTLRQPQTGAMVTSHFVVRGAQLFEFGTATSEADIAAVYGRMIASFKFLK